MYLLMNSSLLSLSRSINLTKAKFSSGIYLRITLTTSEKIPNPQQVAIYPWDIGAVPRSADPRVELPALIMNY